MANLPSNQPSTAHSTLASIREPDKQQLTHGNTVRCLIRLALALLHFLQPLPESFLAALARCACRAPHLTHEIALAVESATGEHNGDPGLTISFALTLALNATTLPTDSVSAEQAESEGWTTCVGVLRRLMRRHGERARTALLSFCNLTPTTTSGVELAMKPTAKQLQLVEAVCAV